MPGFSVPGIGNPNLTGSYTEGARISLTGDPRNGTSDSPYNRINPRAAFTVPGVGTIGLGAPVRYLAGPGMNNSNLSVQKSFSIRERMRLELRADAFNVFNTPTLAASGVAGPITTAD